MIATNLRESQLAEFEMYESNVRYYCRDMPAVLARASNARIWDEEGYEYIDFFSACGSLNYGHNHPLMKRRVIEYLMTDGMLNSLDLHTTAKRDFLRTFREHILAPRGLVYRVQFTGPTGTNAVEAALKLARKVTRRRTVVAFTNAFHGMTLGALAATARQRNAGIEQNGIVRLPFEGYFCADTRDLDRYEAMVNDPSGGAEPPAAFIVETIQGEGGLNSASPEWLRHLAGVAHRLGALLIVDDVQAGCGRTGDFFSFEQSGIVPDLVCLAKSISGNGLPMALLLIKPEWDQWSPGEHNGTFRGNNLAFLAASVAAQLWNDPDFIGSINQSDLIVRAWIDNAVREFGATAKGRGLFSGVSFSDRSLARQVAGEAFQRKLLIETSGSYGEVLKVMPPLTIEPELLSEGLRRLSDAVEVSLSRSRLRTAA
ncbi:diaminobutyrate--2-oxoglutarate transaminase [Pseudorhodoplanes sinuspersici]|uniref:Diaminobutyrate--2-oxoglutarate transaminase n=2 Tax=Pseudorhodoplanes sinuspersici TaxID=1235591 RepID=A0A1W6ZZA3_9HYPH|nr:diaminobutyrate--2-oxoglutarate transaminase [Pseudorhodoplanes sinuspersici]